MTGPQPQGFLAPPASSGLLPQAPPPMGAGMGAAFQTLTAAPPESLAPPASQPAPAAQPKKAPIEFDQAISYVVKIKTRFAKQPETYKAFLEILHTYQKEQKTIKEVYEQVSTLFKHHADLLGEFSQFLPDGSPDSGGGLFGLGGKGKGKASLGMGAAPLKPMAQRPGMKPSNRAQEDADEERYWQKRKNARREAPGGGARDAQRSREAEFFTKCRQRMPKPLYLELLKCLNLFSFKILERSELLTLAHDLFKRSQPDLYQVFRSLLPGYAGGDNRALDDGGDDGRAARPPMADAAHYRELDFSAMKKHGTSYRILPDQYPMPACSGRGPLEQLVLNDAWVSVPTGTEDLNFKTMRKNQYEVRRPPAQYGSAIRARTPPFRTLATALSSYGDRPFLTWRPPSQYCRSRSSARRTNGSSSTRRSRPT